MSTYVTTAISYVNAPPHLGHALELVLADAIARTKRKRGEDVRFLTGTDENSLKNVRAAEDAGVSVRAFVDANAARFADLVRRLEISNDDFIRTTEPRHIEGAVALWRACKEKGDLQRGFYRGSYCVGCEQFYAPEDLVDGKCSEHGIAPEVIEEENWFFDLRRYLRPIRDAIEKKRLEIIPEKAANQVLAELDRDVGTLSVSRSFSRARGWGIPVPGDPEQIIYVWFDALANYLTALGSLRGHYWREEGEQIHVIGKGITRFHALYWPAILLSAGLPLPSKIFVHGYLTVDGKKIGKSSGNAIDPHALIDRAGVDALRYFLLRHVRPHEDADFTLERFLAVRDAELADQLGNLVQRTVRLIERGSNGVVPPVLSETQPLGGSLDGLDPFRPDRALASIFEVVQAANAFIEARAPWKQTGADLSATLGAAAGAIRRVGEALDPYLPSTAEAIRARIGGLSVLAGPPLFAKT